MVTIYVPKGERPWNRVWNPWNDIKLKPTKKVPNRINSFQSQPHPMLLDPIRVQMIITTTTTTAIIKRIIMNIIIRIIRQTLLEFKKLL